MQPVFLDLSGGSRPKAQCLPAPGTPFRRLLHFPFHRILERFEKTGAPPHCGPQWVTKHEARWHRGPLLDLVPCRRAASSPLRAPGPVSRSKAGSSARRAKHSGWWDFPSQSKTVSTSMPAASLYFPERAMSQDTAHSSPVYIGRYVGATVNRPLLILHT